MGDRLGVNNRDRLDGGFDARERARAIIEIIEQDAEERRKSQVAARTALALRRRTYDPDRDPWRDEIRRVIAISAGITPERIEREARLRSRHLAVCAMYEDLRLAGRLVRNIYNLSRAHADVLYRVWSERYTAATVEKRWSLLRSWAITLEKGATMIPMLDAYRERAPARVASPSITAPVVTPQQVDKILSGLQALDQTAWFVQRARTVFGMSTVEALDLQPAAALAGLPGFLVVSRGKGRQGRPIELDTPGKVELAGELAAYVRGQGRSTLGWAGLTPAQALDRYKQCVRTVRARIERAKAARGES